MSDRPDDISEEAWEAADVVGEAMYGRHERGWVSWPLMSRPDGRFAHEIVARAIDQARREGYAAGVRAAAEVAEKSGEVADGRDSFYRMARTMTGRDVANAIRALDGEVK
jgi:hypothetical protein